jgi:hypothetical protein
MLCSLFFIEAKRIGLWLIDAEAKPEKDDLMVNDYDLEECESGKTRILLFQVIGNRNITEWFWIKSLS